MTTLLVCLITAMCGQVPAPDVETISLWPDGPPEQPVAGEVVEARLYHYILPDAGEGRTAIIVCPGGGYGNLATDHEGEQVARWLMQAGIVPVVLHYRHAPNYRHPAPLSDALRAVRTVRSRALEWGIAPDRIGMMGFSAGGHLVATAGTLFDEGDTAAADPVARISSRPDFLVLVYPVITLDDPFAHAGSRRNLLGENPSPELLKRMSPEKQVTALTPPAFLVHSTEDTGVPSQNSVLFYLALRAAGAPAEMHIYAKGPHGFGLALKDPVLGTWPNHLLAWLRAMSLLDAEGASSP